MLISRHAHGFGLRVFTWIFATKRYPICAVPKHQRVMSERYPIRNRRRNNNQHQYSRDHDVLRHQIVEVFHFQRQSESVVDYLEVCPAFELQLQPRRASCSLSSCCRNLPINRIVINAGFRNSVTSRRRYSADKSVTKLLLLPVRIHFTLPVYKIDHIRAAHSGSTQVHEQARDFTSVRHSHGRLQLRSGRDPYVERDGQHSRTERVHSRSIWTANNPPYLKFRESCGPTLLKLGSRSPLSAGIACRSSRAGSVDGN
jgi:hypothetical protein